MKPVPPKAAAAPPANPKRTEHHDSWITTFGDHLRHDVSAMLASPRVQAIERGAHNALAGGETALLDMKSGVTKVGGHLLHKDVSAALASDDKRRAHIAAGADTNSLAFKAGKVATHVVVDTAATVALAAGGEVVLGAAGVGAGAAGLATAAGLEGTAATVAGRLAVGAMANAVGSGAVTGAEGGSVKEILKSAAVGGLSVGVGHAVGEAVAPLSRAVAGRMAQAAPGLSKASGKLVQAGSEVVSGAATGAGVSALTGDKPEDIARNALFGGALSGVSAAIHLRQPGTHEPAPAHPEAGLHAPVPPAPHHEAVPDPGQHPASAPAHPPATPAGTAQRAAAHGPAEPKADAPRPIQDTGATGPERVAGSDAASDHPAAQVGEAAAQQQANPWTQQLGDIGPDDVKVIARRQDSLTPQMRKQLGEDSPITNLLSVDVGGGIITGPTIMNRGALPTVYHDAHAHEGPYSGTYDTSYKDADIRRQIALSGKGLRKTLNFPVAPHIQEIGASKVEGSPNDPAYYLKRQKGREGPENVLGEANILNDKVIIPPPGITDVMGMPKIKPGEYDRSDFEKLIAMEIEPGVTQIRFVSSPAHTTQSYQGPGVDNRHIEMIAKQASQDMKFAGEYPEDMKGLLIGLAGSNPFDPASYKGAYESLDYANKAEASYGLPPGGIKISGFGELTIAKETVGALSAMPALTPKTIRDLSQATSSMRYAGGTTVIHMDASNSVVTPDLLHPGSPNVNTLATQGQAENLDALKQLLKENPDQEVIWAHIGAAVTQKVPKGYTDQIRDMLAEHPNLKIDTSWTATANMISGHALGEPLSKPVDTQNVKKWAEVIVDNPDRFMWGSDTIAASQKGNQDVVQQVYDRFKAIGLLDEIKKIGDQKGSSDAIEKFLTANFEDSIGKAADRVSEFRTNEDNARWLAAGGPSEANGMIPPMQWVKTGTEWTFVKSAEQPHGGNRETYEMPDGVEPAKGAAMIWMPDGKGGYVPSPGPGRDVGDFRDNPNRPR